MNTRLFIESDRERLRHIYLHSRRQAFPWVDPGKFQEDDFDQDTQGEIIWVTTIDDTPVGFLSVWRPENFIHTLFVDPGAAGQGIGSSLLDESLNYLERPAALKCLTKNTKARDFYLAKGWKIISQGSSLEGSYLLMHYEH